MTPTVPAPPTQAPAGKLSPLALAALANGVPLEDVQAYSRARARGLA